MVSSDADVQCTLLTAILDQVQKGTSLSKEVIQTLMEIAFSDSNNNTRAITVLEQINFKALLDRDSLQRLKKQCRQYLGHYDIEMLIGVISILGSLRDIQSYPKIKEFAFSGNKYGVQSIAIKVLAQYGAVYSQDVMVSLHRLYLSSRDKDAHLAGDVLTALATVDLHAIVEYLDDAEARNVMTIFCAKEGVLLFDDGYMDTFGVKHLFKLPEEPLFLNPEIPVRDQLELLRQACLDALNQKRVQKTSVNRNGGRPPLFTKTASGVNENYFTDGVSYNTGQKFLKGSDIDDSSAQMIFNRLRKICPDLFME